METGTARRRLMRMRHYLSLASAEADELRQLVKVTPTVAIMATAGALLLAGPFMEGTGSQAVMLWLAAFCGVSLIRVAGGFYFKQAARRAQVDVRWWGRWALGSSMVHALLWGLCSLLLLQAGGAEAETMMHVVLAAVAMGAAVHLSSFYPVLVAYVACVICPLVLRDVMIGGGYHVKLGFLSALIGVYSLAVGRNQSRALAEIVAQRRENAKLIEALRVENAAHDTARRAAEQANAAKSRFFAAANHDLRQPLHAMGLMAQTLRTSSREQVSEVAGHLVECVDGMTAVVDELLEIARLDSTHIAVQPSSFALDGLLRELRQTYRALALAKGLRLEIEGGAGLAVHTDRALLARVLANLLSNAVRYTPEGGIRVVVEADAAQVRLRVEDSGIGIAPEHLPRIFEEFYQAGNPARDRRLGLGLGLATVKRLSDLLGLDVSVRSTPAQGSVFALRLARAEAAPSSAAAPEPAPLPLARQRVLVVEDEADSRRALQALLAGWDCEVRTAADIGAALQWLAQGFRPEVLVVDLRLADGASGVDAVAALREAAGRELPALIVTGDVGSERMRQAQAKGFTVMVKPVKPMQLRAFLGQAASA